MSKAAASRWLASHVGHMVETEQRGPDGRVKWAPGPRKLAGHGATGFTLDGSHTSNLNDSNVRAEMTEHGPVIHWHDDDGSLIHSTHYRVANQNNPIPRVQHLMAVHSNEGLVVLPSKQAP